MFNSKSPATLFVRQLDSLRSHLPGVRDGHESSIHDSRVATRRIRELLQFASSSSSRSAEELGARFRKMGKALGRVRDADVRIELISSLETRIPQGSPWLVTVRHAQERNREKLVRRLIKRLEKLEIDRLIDHATARHSRLRPVLDGMSRTTRCRRDLCRMITTRARTTAESIEHATGVYFPNRIHRARIALKHLRYALEIADEMGGPDLEAPLRALRKAQGVLGELHDRQTLLDVFASMELPAADSQLGGLIVPVKQVVEAEAHTFHARYLSRRAALLDIAREAQTIRLDRSWLLPSLMTASAGALVLSTGVFVGQRRQRLAAAPVAAGP